MKASLRIVVFIVLVLALPARYGTVAHADEATHPSWKEGRIRLELARLIGINSASEPRKGDVNFMGSIEFEGPLTTRLTLGPKFIPVFTYDPGTVGAADISGGALGGVLRYYLKPGGYRGFFVEAGSAALVTSRKFDKNSGTLNFIVEFGAGYAFKSGWHAAVKFRHISNAYLASRNAGADAVGLGLGYRF
ncbi:MAG: acyloxyacyl hydrolase [Candidatus Hydrogenedentes bacterium]|nr:acyloxyacyl hydrolase [Candidatus Hydrogenedentota bacterium]